MTESSRWGQKIDKPFLEVKRRCGPKKKVEKDRQLLTEKIIYNVEKENPYTIEIEEKNRNYARN